MRKNMNESNFEKKYGIKIINVPNFGAKTAEEHNYKLKVLLIKSVYEYLYGTTPYVIMGKELEELVKTLRLGVSYVNKEEKISKLDIIMRDYISNNPDSVTAEAFEMFLSLGLFRFNIVNFAVTATESIDMYFL